MTDPSNRSVDDVRNPNDAYLEMDETSYRIENYDGRNSSLGPKSARKGKLNFPKRPAFALTLGPMGGFTTGEPLKNCVFTWEAKTADKFHVRIARRDDPNKFWQFDVVDAGLVEFSVEVNRRIALANQIEGLRLEQQPNLPSVRPVVLNLASYLGGLIEDIPPYKGSLVLDAYGIGVRPNAPGYRRGIRWGDCAGITIDGGEVAKRKVGAVLAFGVLGGLAAKGTKGQTVVTARHRNGSAAYFLVDGRNPHEVRAAIHPLLHKVGVPFLDELQAPVPGPEQDARADVHSMAAQLRELSALRDEGLLTDEEFAEQKARLLS